MQADQTDLNLTRFRRRIRLLRVWRCGAMGGCLGAAVAVAMAALDLFSVRYFDSWMLAVPVGLGVAGGALKALAERLPGGLVARSVDRRGGLEDRLTTAAEVPAESGALAGALHDDASRTLGTVRPAALYPLRPGRWHGALLTLAALSASLFLLGNTAVFRSEQAKKEAADLKQSAAEVERVARPVLAEAKRADADAAEKELARRLERFASELRKARMSRPEALVKANQLAEEAKKLETSRARAMADSAQSAQTAAAKLQQMAERASLEKSDELKQAEQAAALENEIAAAERKLAPSNDAEKAGKDGLSRAEKAALEKRLDQMKQQLREIRLSQQAQEFLRKLQSMPEFKQAQELLAKLAASAAAQQAAGQQTGAQQASQAPPMTPEQLAAAQKALEAAAKRMDELAKQFNSDEKVRELAQQLLAAAKNAQLCKGGQCSGGLLGAFGLGAGAAMGGAGLSLGGKGSGGISSDRWVGAHGSLSKDDKSSLLSVKFEDRVITSQTGQKGPQTYTEVLGPSAPGGKSAVPYQKVLPKYEKSAQSALAKGDIPPRLRGKVRDYFDSLRR